MSAKSQAEKAARAASGRKRVKKPSRAVTSEKSAMRRQVDQNKAPDATPVEGARELVVSAAAGSDPLAPETVVVEKSMGVAASPEPEALVELFPQGISIGSAIGRPVLILKDQAGVEVLPVWMQPLDAGVALAELSHQSGSTPHAVSKRLLASLGLKIESCVFVDVIGHHQFVDLSFVSSDAAPSVVKVIRVRADEAMSFCLQGKARFFSSKAMMARCRSLDADLAKFEENLVHGQLPQLTAEMEISSKKQPYMM